MYVVTASHTESTNIPNTLRHFYILKIIENEEETICRDFLIVIWPWKQKYK